MRIAFFTDTYEPQVNGVVTSINSFSEELRRRGHEVHIFCPQSGDIKETDFVHTLPSLKFYPYPEYRISLPDKKVYDLIKKINPDIIHIQSPASMGLMGVVLAKKFKIPIFATYHTMLTEFLQYIPGYSILAKNLSKKTMDTYTNWFFNNVDFVIVPGTIAKNYLRRIGVKKPIEILQTGIKVKSFAQVKKIEPPIILHVGRLSDEKNVGLIIKAFKKVKERTDAKLVITSDGPAKENLEYLVYKAGLSDDVEFTGYISESEKEELYRKSTAFAMASAVDTQGLVVLEAMGFGLPVIVAKAGGPTNFVSNEKNGLFFKPNNEADLAEKILKLLRNKKLQKNLSDGGLATAKELSIEICSEKLETLYHSAFPSKKVSVVIPTYLEEKYLEKILKSTREQSYKNLEIIVVDSDSGDRTRHIAKRLADKVINLKKRGVSLARNMGAKAAKGEVILFIDADMILEKDFIKKVVREFDDKRVVAASGYVYTDGSLLDKAIFSGTSEISWISTVIGHPLFYGMCMAVRKTAFEKIGGFDLRYETAEDYNLSERLKKIGMCVFVRDAKAFTSSRRTEMMGSLYSVFYHISNFIKYKLTKDGRKGYPVLR